MNGKRYRVQFSQVVGHKCEHEKRRIAEVKGEDRNIPVILKFEEQREACGEANTDSRGMDIEVRGDGHEAERVPCRAEHVWLRKRRGVCLSGRGKQG